MLTARAALDDVRCALLVARAWLGLACFDLLLLTGFARAHEFVRTCPVQEGPPPFSIAQIVWAVDEACVWYVKRTPCLQRSAVATCLLRQYGVRAAMVIAYRALPFESHAWVEVDGRIVNDRQQYRHVFAVLERL